MKRAQIHSCAAVLFVTATIVSCSENMDLGSKPGDKVIRDDSMSGIEKPARDRGSSNVQRIHAEEEEAHKSFDAAMQSVGGTIDVRNACKSLLTKIVAIPLTGCPDDYREQFADYLSELRNLCETLDSHPVEPPVSPEERIAADQSQERLLDGIKRTNESGEKLRHIAKKYGATSGH